MTIPAGPPAADYTIDELIAVCIARQVRDGDHLAHGLATPLVAAGYILAQRTHAPHAYFASAVGQGVVYGWAPLGVARVEELWLGKALANVTGIDWFNGLGESVSLVTGLIFIICVLAFRRGLVGEALALRDRFRSK